MYLFFFNSLTCLIVLLTCSQVTKKLLVFTCNWLDWTCLNTKTLNLFNLALSSNFGCFVEKLKPALLYFFLFNWFTGLTVLLTCLQVTKKLLVVICISLDRTWLVRNTLNLVYLTLSSAFSWCAEKKFSRLFCAFVCSIAVSVQFLLLTCSQVAKILLVVICNSLDWTWLILNNLNLL